MSRDITPLKIADVSQFARALRASLNIEAGHQSVLNAIARAGGYSNFQHLKSGAATASPDRPTERALAWFDDAGRLTGWPAKRSVRQLALWAIWAQIPARAVMTEREISARIDAMCSFRDAAQIRRSLIEDGLLSRNRDGSEYVRVEQQPPPQARTMIALLTK